MPWTTPKNWSVGELLIASDFNTHIRDNLLYLYQQASFLHLGTRTTLGAAAATMGITGIDTSWEILRFLIYARTATAAAIDTIRLRFGGASLDTTAGNYFSYMHLVNTTTPTHSVSENLGATAGIGGAGIAVPGNTATASYFGLIEVVVFGGSVLAGYKEVLVRGFDQNTDATANMWTFNGGGKWKNTTNTLQQISVITTSGANLAQNSWISVFGGST